MEEIFALQWKLNAYTLRNIGVDYAEALTDPQQKVVWIENFRKALSAELAELVREVREFGMASDNGKIEIVDILHFLVSLSHLVAVLPDEIPEAPAGKMPFDTLAMGTFLALDDLQNSLKWKWWAKGGGYQAQKARQAVMDLWRCFNGLSVLFGMDPARVKRIYVGKNEVNFTRQDQGYSEDSKTEHDNEALGALVHGKSPS